MVFTTKGFFEVAIESRPEWDLNPRPLTIIYIYIYIYNYIGKKMTLLDERHFGNQIVSKKITGIRIGLLRKNKSLKKKCRKAIKN